MKILPEYDVAIVGGGLAGLAASIQLSRKGYTVIVFEKDAYPSHKVCGEYISLESRGFLRMLGVPLEDLPLPIIDTLHLTSPNGRSFITKLPLGGFGISRYLLDNTLAQLAVKNGVHLLQKTKVDAITLDTDRYIIHHHGQAITAHACCSAHGKRGNLDIKWSRSFLKQNNDRLNNYVAVKYHVKTVWQENVIGLHNFKDGYCGISKIEDDKYCLCYMTKAGNLKRHNSIQQMEEAVLFKNPHLKKIFAQSEMLESFPITISQISFSRKTKVENGVLMLGDAAGMITPLCGNGMSIALHTSKIASNLVDDFLQQRITQAELEKQYTIQWKQHFSSRLKTGRIIQSFFGSTTLSNAFVGTFKALPFLAKPLIRQTHGMPF